MDNMILEIDRCLDNLVAHKVSTKRVSPVNIKEGFNASIVTPSSTTACSCSSSCGSNFSQNGTCSCSSSCGSNYSRMKW